VFSWDTGSTVSWQIAPWSIACVQLVKLVAFWSYAASAQQLVVPSDAGWQIGWLVVGSSA
jgi:hypothetical protein